MNARFAFEVGSTLCLQITVVIAATFALQRWIIDARWGCRLWTACFVCVIGLLAAACLLPHPRWFHFPDDLPPERVVDIVQWQSRIAITLGIVWGLGMCVSLVKRAVLCLGLLQFLKHHCTPVVVAELLNRLELASTAPKNLSILSSADIQGPFCWQLHSPVIVLPSFLLAEGEMTLRHVLLHELEHLRTQHPMQHFLQGVCSTIFWFHPLVWSAARGAELTREYLCDEVAAKAVGKYGAYLRTLAVIAERCGSVACTEVPRGTLAFGNQKSSLLRRTERLVELARRETRPSKWPSTLALCALPLCTVLVQQVWLPTNAMASQRSRWSPWPTWSADALHQLGVQVRDFESFEDRVQLHEWIRLRSLRTEEQ